MNQKSQLWTKIKQTELYSIIHLQQNLCAFYYYHQYQSMQCAQISGADFILEPINQLM